MSLRLTALAAWAAAACVALPAAAADPLTLDDAFRRVIAFHPELRLAGAQREALGAERDLAAQRPALQAGAELENALGSGGYQGLQAAELTLHLGSVLERGDKARSRVAVVQEELGALHSAADARRLDLLAEVARRYLAAAAAGQRQELEAADVTRRQRTVDIARARHAAGAAPEAVVLAAEAALARALLARERAAMEAQAAQRHLGTLWGERGAGFAMASTDLLALPRIGPLEALAALLDASPEVTRFASERRIREARLRLARAEGTADVQWQAGVRRIESSNDFALVAGVTVPLGTRARAAPRQRAAAAELASLELTLESTALALQATLTDAHARFTLAQLEVAQLDSEVLPRLMRAEAAAARAWNAGATSFADWAQLQSELNDTRRQQLQIAIEAHQALIEIQRLTGHAFLDSTATAAGELR